MTPEQFFEIARRTTWRETKGGAIRNAPSNQTEFCPTSFVQLFLGRGANLKFSSVSVALSLALDVQFVRRVQYAADGIPSNSDRAWLIEQLGASFDPGASWLCAGTTCPEVP